MHRPERREAVRQRFVLQAISNCSVRLGCQADKVILDIRTHQTAMGNGARFPERLVTHYCPIDLPQRDPFWRAREADTSISAERRVDKAGVCERL
jgi:hypothetical protein